MRRVALCSLIALLLTVACGRAVSPETEWVSVTAVSDDSGWSCTYRHADGREGRLSSFLFERDFRTVVPIPYSKIAVGSRFRLNADGCVMEVAP